MSSEDTGHYTVTTGGQSVVAVEVSLCSHSASYCGFSATEDWWRAANSVSEVVPVLSSDSLSRPAPPGQASQQEGRPGQSWGWP